MLVCRSLDFISFAENSFKPTNEHVVDSPFPCVVAESKTLTQARTRNRSSCFLLILITFGFIFNRPCSVIRRSITGYPIRPACFGNDGGLRIGCKDARIFSVNVDAAAVKIDNVPRDIAVAVSLDGCSREIPVVFVPCSNIIPVTCIRLFSASLLPKVQASGVGVFLRAPGVTSPVINPGIPKAGLVA